ncbi:hypothetical protein [Nocardiopsis coralliicola]
MPKPSQVSVKLSIPMFGEISGVWEPDDAERRAAWELYVELITRVTVVDLRPDEGLMREALGSVYTLFGSTREILRRYGPDVALRRPRGKLSFGAISVAVLNGALRPFLARWHPALTSYEATLPEGGDLVAHERAWEHADELRRELAEVRTALTDLARLLAEVAGVADFHGIASPHDPDGRT